jgi:hypothetical protein
VGISFRHHLYSGLCELLATRHTQYNPHSAGCIFLNGSLHAVSIETIVDRAYLRMVTITASDSEKLLLPVAFCLRSGTRSKEKTLTSIGEVHSRTQVRRRMHKASNARSR